VVVEHAPDPTVHEGIGQGVGEDIQLTLQFMISRRGWSGARLVLQLTLKFVGRWEVDN
jgi:hypothetical protein